MLALGFGVYLALSVLCWWGVWSSHPSSTTTCGCGDASLFMWYIQWPATALAHGHDPFFSTALFQGTGVNLLSNTSVTAVGLLFVPVTWVFGPIATLNVASTLCPPLSALAMFWLVRRWVDWTPAAFIAGLFYGFSPFVLVNLTSAHLMLAMMMVPPLIVGCLDELLVRQRRRPVRVGVVLALLVSVQFFLGTEMLGIMAITGVVTLVLLGGYGLLFARPDLRRRLPHAARGLATAGGLGAVLLAYPAWFALAGPAHLAGLVWPGVPPGLYGQQLSNFWLLSPPSPDVIRAWHLTGGYQGTWFPNAFFGVGLLVVLGAGVVLWWRDRRLWFFGILGLAGVALSLGAVNKFWVPWRLLTKVPVVQNILADRFVAMTYLCAAVMLGVIVDRVYRAVTGAAARRVRAPGGRSRYPVGRLATRAGPALVALAVAAGALFQTGSALAGMIPITVEPVVLPAWFTQVAPSLPPGRVVQAYPAAFSGMQSALDWQAVDRMHFAMADVGNPEAIPSRAGKERPGFEVISALSGQTPLPLVTAANLAAVRNALTGWGVTTVVIPDQPELPAYQTGKATSYALGFYTAALGVRPSYRSRAWVFGGVDVRHRPVSISEAAFRACVGTANFPAGPPGTVPDCILAAGAPPVPAPATATATTGAGAVSR